MYLIFILNALLNIILIAGVFFGTNISFVFLITFNVMQTLLILLNQTIKRTYLHEWAHGLGAKMESSTFT